MIWWSLWWWGLEARLSYLWHALRSHDVRWRSNADEAYEACSGDITCETCNVLFWCRGSAIREE